MTTATEAFDLFAKSTTGSGSRRRKDFFEALVGPECHLVRALGDGRQYKKLAAAVASVENYVNDNLPRLEDESLADRWSGMVEFVRYLGDGEPAHLQRSRQHFDKALATLAPKFMGAASPGEEELRRIPGKLRGTFFFEDHWSPATYLLYGWLQGLLFTNRPTPYPDGPPYAYERTPILSAVVDQTGNYNGSVHTLIVHASSPAEATVIYPDLIAFGLIRFKKWAEGKRETNFVAEMQEALRRPIPANRSGCLRWFLAAHKDYPEVLMGRSATVSAACCARALFDPERVFPPLLDEYVAVTACLAEGDGGEESALEPSSSQHDSGDDEIQRLRAAAADKVTPAITTELAKVDEQKLKVKFAGAAVAKLAGVLVCESQLPLDPEEQRGDDITLIQPVRTLEEAYAGLLRTSRAVAKYKRALCQEWEKIWVEEKTPELLNMSHHELDKWEEDIPF